MRTEDRILDATDKIRAVAKGLLQESASTDYDRSVIGGRYAILRDAVSDICEAVEQETDEGETEHGDHDEVAILEGLLLARSCLGFGADGELENFTGAPSHEAMQAVYDELEPMVDRLAEAQGMDPDDQVEWGSELLEKVVAARAERGRTSGR